MSKTFKKIIKLTAIIFCVALIVSLYPIVAAILIFWVICGLVDVMRNNPVNFFLLKSYFFGNGVLTFLLSPLNLLCDLVCYKNLKLYKLEDYNIAGWGEEINEVLNVFNANKTEIMSSLDVKMKSKKRGMIFYKWYGRNYDYSIKDLNKDFRYIKTIGVSVFSPNQSTSWHFGPFRFTFRILYNLLPINSDKAYISTMGNNHYWNKEAFFSFDDTLFHKSVNETDSMRYCAFIDVIRPTPVPLIINAIVVFTGSLMNKVRSIFYKNWDFI